MRDRLARIASIRWLAGVAALLGAAVCAWQLWMYAHTQVSVLDEGAYLLKGYLFVSGQYQPFQAYGPWTNHMPLAFLIPGAIQQWFGPGLAAARYFAVALTLFQLLGIWILARRLGGAWWAAGAVWVMALNPGLLKPYSTAVSQGLIACMLVWALVFVLGEKRPLWQIGLGAWIAALMGLTRFNMLPFFPFLVVYIFWQHGRKAGMLALLVGGLTLFIGHAIYWPDIMRLYIKIPKAISPFLNRWRLGLHATPVWKPQTDLASQVLSFFQGLRFQFVAAVGVFCVWMLWPPRRDWRSASDFKVAVFLSVLYLVLLLTHMWAALVKDYCPFCFAGYLAFFSVLGLLLLIVSAPTWSKTLPLWRQMLIAAVLLILTAGIGYSTFEETGNWLLEVQVPRVLLGKFGETGSASIGALIVNKFGLDVQLLRKLVPALAGLGLGLLLLAAGYVFGRLRRRAAANGAPTQRLSAGYFALVITLILGMLLSPTILLGGGYTTYDCAGDVIASNRILGEYLRENIPPGSLVYWRGGLSAAPLLYVPDIRIYPPQINDGYSFYLDGDPELLLREGRWNRALDQQWLQEADVVLIEDRIYSQKYRDALGATTIQLPLTPPTVTCRGDSRIRIFLRLQ